MIISAQVPVFPLAAYSSFKRDLCCLTIPFFLLTTYHENHFCLFPAISIFRGLEARTECPSPGKSRRRRPRWLVSGAPLPRVPETALPVAGLLIPGASGGPPPFPSLGGVGLRGAWSACSPRGFRRAAPRSPRSLRKFQEFAGGCGSAASAFAEKGCRLKLV